MKKGLLGSIATLLTGAGLALADGPPAAAPIMAAPVAATYAPSENYSMSDSGGSAGNSLWFSAEYLLWWVKDQPAPPLVTSGNRADFNPGALDQPGTVIVIGGDVETSSQAGGRFTAGYWLDDDQATGVEVNFFFLGKRTANQFAFSSGAPDSATLGLPFFNTDLIPQAQDISQSIATIGSFPEGTLAFPGVAFPGIGFASGLRISNQMYGTEANVLCKLACGDNWRVYGLGGFRYMQIDEKLSFDTLTFGTGGALAGFGVRTVDQFRTRNNFYGLQAGLRGEFTMDRFFIAATGKVGLGDNHQILDIGGQTTINAAAAAGIPPQSVLGGFYAQGTNIGHYHRDKFAVLPEITVNAGANVTDNLRAFVGYNFLYLNHTMRPGNAIDQSVDPSTFAFFGVDDGNAKLGPSVKWNESDFWVQGFNFGLEFRY